ncbi:hypothetical protein [Thalassotalea sp. G2M2-11]|uniref:hypothetical protein n=1 Tax=Thalassotalea sp. G2M2-11 TaxID=2787627 RepID=UPI0019D153A3|nr:hypothetical protein [Thalassotalea sp. G2M2-11]
MNTWWVINLGDAMLADAKLAKIESVLIFAVARANTPDKMAAFLRYETEGGLHCKLKLYLSPLFGEIAQPLDAKPCTQPDVNDLSLFIGHQQALRTLFY